MVFHCNMKKLFGFGGLSRNPHPHQILPIYTFILRLLILNVCFIMQLIKLSLVNLAGEYMDIVIALSLEWIDPRLKWDKDQFGDVPIKDIRVKSKDIWTPNIDFANRIFDFSPTSEIDLKATVSHEGNVTS